MPDGSLSIAPATGHDQVDQEVGARIRLRRSQLRMTQSELAVALGISFQQVQKYERGSNRISASMLARAARKLDVPVGWFFGESGDAPPVDPDLLDLLVSAAGRTLIAHAKGLDLPRLTALSRVAQALGETL